MFSVPLELKLAITKSVCEASRFIMLEEKDTQTLLSTLGAPNSCTLSGCVSIWGEQSVELWIIYSTVFRGPRRSNCGNDQSFDWDFPPFVALVGTHLSRLYGTTVWLCDLVWWEVSSPGRPDEELITILWSLFFALFAVLFPRGVSEVVSLLRWELVFTLVIRISLMPEWCHKQH